MAELHIDDDWKKQAQEEKRKLVEQEAERAARAAAPAPVAQPTASTPMGEVSPEGARMPGGGRVEATTSFATIVQSLWTQAMLYLGELAPAGAEPMLNLDKARQQFDLLTILEVKTKGNLDEQERHLLDAALYETSSRFINVASQFL